MPTFPARWVLEDPRRRPYLVFWVADDGSLPYLLRMQRIDDGLVGVATPTGRSRRIGVLRRALPNGTGATILYRCPVCKRPRRYLYGLAASLRGLVDDFGFQCQACAGLRWASQGRYRIKLERSLAIALAPIYGQSVRTTMPRTPWDPRAVSDPGLVIEEFPNDLVEAGRKDCRRRSVLRRPAIADDDLVPLEEVFRRAQAGEPTPSPELPGMPRPRRRLSQEVASDDRDQRAVEELPRALARNCVDAGPMAFLRGLSFLHRVLG